LENAKRIYRNYKNEKIKKQSQDKNKEEDQKLFSGFIKIAVKILYF
jgi:hypothetical protein